jgi:hypothetical protein
MTTLLSSEIASFIILDHNLFPVRRFCKLFGKSIKIPDETPAMSDEDRQRGCEGRATEAALVKYVEPLFQASFNGAAECYLKRKPRIRLLRPEEQYNFLHNRQE